jgi:hypothetical protein
MNMDLTFKLEGEVLRDESAQYLSPFHLPLGSGGNMDHLLAIASPTLLKHHDQKEGVKFGIQYGDAKISQGCVAGEA